MVMIQESSHITGRDKPLRISGDPQRVKVSKEISYPTLYLLYNACGRLRNLFEICLIFNYREPKT